jgi:hypothetical protein
MSTDRTCSTKPPLGRDKLWHPHLSTVPASHLWCGAAGNVCHCEVAGSLRSPTETCGEVCVRASSGGGLLIPHCNPLPAMTANAGNQRSTWPTRQHQGKCYFAVLTSIPFTRTSELFSRTLSVQTRPFELMATRALCSRPRASMSPPCGCTQLVASCIPTLSPTSARFTRACELVTPNKIDVATLSCTHGHTHPSPLL